MSQSPTTSEPAEYPSIASSLFQLSGHLLLVVVTMVLVFWNLLFVLNSWVQLPANDFGRMLASAQAFMAGQDMYAWTTATPARLHGLYAIDLYNMNPPHFHVLLLPLTLLPSVDHAFVFWWVFSGLCLYLVVKWTLAELAFTPGPEQRKLVILATLCFCGTASMLFTSQLTFVLLIPITLMWLAARRGLWGWAGALLGLALSVKPFLGVVLAYFIWQRRWRAAFTCLGSMLLCFAVGLLVFGLDNHLSWRHKLSVSDGWAWLPMNAGLMGILTRTFTESVWYVPLLALPQVWVWGLWVGIGGVIGLLTLLATTKGQSREEVDHDLALLLLASILLCPLGWVYYFWLALPPMVALVIRGWPSLPAAELNSPARLRWACVLLTVTWIAAAWPTIGTRLGQPDFIWFWAETPPAITLMPDPENPGPLPQMLVRTDIPRWNEPWFFAPDCLATMTVGSIYFWGLLTIWITLVWSGLVLRRQPATAAIPALETLAAEDYRVSVLMPVYSETDTVRDIALWLTRELGPQLEEIIIVQSPRSSAESQAICRQLVAEQPHIRLQVQQENPGLGRAVRQGFRAVRGNVVLWIDSDGEMEIETVPRLLQEMARGNHALVTASRWLPGGGFSGYDPLKKRLNWCFQQLFRWLFWTRLTDLTYGFKLMRTELAQGIDWEGTLHEIACETTLKPVRLGVPVAEVPSRWTARTQGVSKNTFWRNFRYVHLAISILVQGVVLNPAVPSASSIQLQAGKPDGVENEEPIGVL